MALKIRRGTEAERAALTGTDPALGEPIFVTDTGKLWVGDGTTGGVQINPDLAITNLTDVDTSMSPANGQLLTWSTPNMQWEAQTLSVVQDIQDLNNVDTTGVANGKILKYDAALNNPDATVGGWVVSDEYSFDLDTVIGGKSINIIGDVSTDGLNAPANGQYLLWDDVNGYWKPGDINLSSSSISAITADVTGSVFADDSTVMIDAVAGTVNLTNGVLSVVQNEIQATGTNLIKIGNNTDVNSLTFQVTNVDASEAIEVVNKAGNSVNNTSKLTFSSRHGADMENPVAATAGDWVGTISGRAFDPLENAYIPSSIFAMTLDNNEAIAQDTAKGKFLFINNSGTGTSPVLNVMSYDARGYLAINNNANYVADATLDVNGFMKMAPLTAEPTAVEGMMAIADGTTWDPASKGGAVSYPVYYDGNAWNALY